MKPDTAVPTIPPRSSVVKRLADAALQGMVPTVEAEVASATEVMSAAFTLTNSLVGIMLDHGAEPSVLRVALQQMLVQCTEKGPIQ